MQIQHTIIDIDSRKYAVFELKYLYDEYSDIFLIGEFKNSVTAKVYVLVPSWVEIQDLFNRSAEKNIMTEKFEINEDKEKVNKVLMFCNRIINDDGSIVIMNKKILENLHKDLGEYLYMLVEYTIREHNIGGFKTEEESRHLAERCFEYYSAKEKQDRGGHVKVPPPPGIVVLLNVCDIFNCTPDVARKISYADIQDIFTARRQETLSKILK